MKKEKPPRKGGPFRRLGARSLCYRCLDQLRKKEKRKEKRKNGKEKRKNTPRPKAAGHASCVVHERAAHVSSIIRNTWTTEVRFLVKAAALAHGRAGALAALVARADRHQSRGFACGRGRVAPPRGIGSAAKLEAGRDRAAPARTVSRLPSVRESEEQMGRTAASSWACRLDHRS